MTSFEILAQDGKARRGRLNTAHGVVNTPAFMPVGTAGTVKAMLPESVRIGHGQFMNLCRPPRVATRSAPGRSIK